MRNVEKLSNFTIKSYLCLNALAAQTGAPFSLIWFTQCLYEYLHVVHWKSYFPESGGIFSCYNLTCTIACLVFVIRTILHVFFMSLFSPSQLFDLCVDSKLFLFSGYMVYQVRKLCCFRRLRWHLKTSTEDKNACYTNLYIQHSKLEN